METLNLKQFDLMGIFTLNDIKGIEKLVTKCKEGYLSRSPLYYTVQNYSERSALREELKKLLINAQEKRAFVIAENMLNCSAKVYYNELKKKFRTKNGEHYEIARMCVEEDTKNLINVIEGKPAEINAELILPQTQDLTESRMVGMDNKSLLYVFTKSFFYTKDYHIVTPGLGSIYIGPFFKAIHGLDYSNFLLSLYSDRVEDPKGRVRENILSNFMDNRDFIAKKQPVLILDDNIVTGATVNKTAKMLFDAGLEADIGAVQYNWVNFYAVKSGVMHTPTFDVDKITYLTPIDFNDNKNLMTSAINALAEGGDDYIKLLKNCGFYNNDKSDVELLIETGLAYAEKSNIVFDNRLYQGKHPYKKITKTSVVLSQKIAAFYKENA